MFQKDGPEVLKKLLGFDGEEKKLQAQATGILPLTSADVLMKDHLTIVKWKKKQNMYNLI